MAFNPNYGQYGIFGNAQGLAGGYNAYGQGTMDLSGLLNYNTSNGLGSNAGGTNWFGSGGILNTLGGLALGGLSAYTGLQNLSLSKKQLGLARDQFAFEKGLANRNLANHAQTINNTYNNAATVAAGMVGSLNPDGTIGQTDAATAQRIQDSAKDKHVDGSPINA